MLWKVINYHFIKMNIKLYLNIVKKSPDTYFRFTKPKYSNFASNSDIRN